MNNNRRLYKTGWPPVLAVFLFLFIWQLATFIWKPEAWFLPSPLVIFQEGWNQAPQLTQHLWATLQITLLGFAIGSTTGLILAFLLHVTPPMKAALYPLLILSQNIPTIILAPLLMIWFGFGLLPKMILITLVCFFPVTLSTMTGLAQTDSQIKRYMLMIGATRQQIFWKLELPHSLASMFSGLKISATYSVMGAVISEWLGSQKGIGVYMLMAKASFRADRVFVTMFLIVIVSCLLFGLIRLLERWALRWQSNKRD
ncbi:nitrate ABC transporter permease [Brevibacillus halotolerans]|uniref:ABC transporter permease n=1 Tax=Brevibacillus halotolerans TaxID=1507437 RepID=UPI001B0C9C0C|nr:ABC transporter permease [Brevibacillus halotolerans]GIN99763.1 nitrate ABC transporter permease [Brevibacillus halotolerans]